MIKFIKKPKKWTRTAFTLLLVVIFLTAVGAQNAHALTQSDWKNLYTPFYDPDSTDALCSGNFSGSNNAEIAFNYLTSQGLTAAQTAGVVGNLMTESGEGIDPRAVSPSGYTGIAQWDRASRWPRLVEWAQQNQRDEFELETQLEYLWFEATGRGNIEGIKAYDEVEYTAWYWGRFFEVAIIDGDPSEEPLTNVQDLGGRTEHAKSVMDLYSESAGSLSCTRKLGKIQCPANMEAHPTRSGYYKLPNAPNKEYTIYSTDQRRYGSQELVCVLYSVALAYHEAMAGRSKLHIGDLNAGSPHTSHKWGVAVDLSGTGELQAASHTASWKGVYSKEATVLLGKLFIDTGLIRNIWWCPPAGDDSIQQILKYASETQGGIEGQMKCLPGHDNHFHVDIQAKFRLSDWTP